MIEKRCKEAGGDQHAADAERIFRIDPFQPQKAEQVVKTGQGEKNNPASQKRFRAKSNRFARSGRIRSLRRTDRRWRERDLIPVTTFTRISQPPLLSIL